MCSTSSIVPEPWCAGSAAARSMLLDSAVNAAVPPHELEEAAPIHLRHGWVTSVLTGRVSPDDDGTCAKGVLQAHQTSGKGRVSLM